MVKTRRLIVDAKTGKTTYATVDIDLPPGPEPLGGRDLAQEVDDLKALLKAKGILQDDVSNS